MYRHMMMNDDDNFNNDDDDDNDFVVRFTNSLCDL
jgi:hypothetical protein